jgi:hypothetical protein
MSRAARNRIAEAQRKRWAAFRQRSTPAKKETAESRAIPKHQRSVSKEGRARIIAATKKRWAEFRRAKKEAAVRKPDRRRKTASVSELGGRKAKPSKESTGTKRQGRRAAKATPKTVLKPSAPPTEATS